MREIGPGIPMTALIPGLAGLIPFIWGALVMQTGLGTLPMFPDPRTAVLVYGLMIFCFMAGTFWGLAARKDWDAGYGLSVTPIIYVILFAGLGMALDFVLLIGFVLLLSLDFIFMKAQITPPWWMKLRLMLTAVVVACLVAMVRVGA